MPVTLDCTRCNGTGLYSGTRRDGSTYEGPCFACHGGGPRYRRGYRNNAARRDYAAVTVGSGAHAVQVPVIAAAPIARAPAAAPVYTGRQRGNLDAFAVAQPAAYGWLMANAGNNEFAASLLNGCARYGGLTPRQLACVVRNLDGAADRAAIVAPPIAVDTVPSDSAIGFIDPIPAGAPVAPVVTPPAVVEPVMVNLDRVRAAMESARASGLRKVSLTFGNVTMKLSGPSFRSGAGMILCYFNGSYCGVVDQGNVFRTRFGATAAPDALEAFRAVGVDPQAAARTHGQDTGHCACCRRLLTDPVSVMANIGPVCARRFGWSF